MILTDDWACLITLFTVEQLRLYRALMSFRSRTQLIQWDARHEMLRTFQAQWPKKVRMFNLSAKLTVLTQEKSVFNCFVVDIFYFRKPTLGGGQRSTSTEHFRLININNNNNNNKFIGIPSLQMVFPKYIWAVRMWKIFPATNSCWEKSDFYFC